MLDLAKNHSVPGLRRRHCIRGSRAVGNVLNLNGLDRISRINKDEHHPIVSRRRSRYGGSASRGDRSLCSLHENTLPSFSLAFLWRKTVAIIWPAHLAISLLKTIKICAA